MSSLTERLRGIVRTGAPSASASVAVSAERARASNLEEALEGAWSEDRRCFTVERRVDADSLHGLVRIGDMSERLDVACADASVLRPINGDRLTPAPFFFFDLETTGLSGGAGTHAFLVGMGWFDGGDFVVRQHVLVDYSTERSMLGRVALDFGRAGSLVSFNGKSFDAPVLDTRYLFHRLEWPGPDLPHVDALHPSRRFWRQAEHGARESCSLITLEREILGVCRQGDVSGFEIPARYFNYVRTGDAEPLAGVLEHNRLDLLSLAALTARLVELVVDGPLTARTPWEALALGRAYAREGATTKTCGALERAVAMSTGRGAAADAPKIEALRTLAVVLRRARRFEEAAASWQQLLDVPSCPPLVAREANQALAVHHEHRVRDLAAAKTFALQSLKICEEDAGWSDAVRHRLQRLERKERRTPAPVSGRPLFPSLSSSSLLSPPSSGSQTSARRTSS